jgi:hypothetical protein
MNAFIQKYGSICKPEMIMAEWRAVKNKWNFVEKTVVPAKFKKGELLVKGEEKQLRGSMT